MALASQIAPSMQSTRLKHRHNRTEVEQLLGRCVQSMAMVMVAWRSDPQQSIHHGALDMQIVDLPPVRMFALSATLRAEQLAVTQNRSIFELDEGIHNQSRPVYHNNLL
jgi:hypothetical protein